MKFKGLATCWAFYLWALKIKKKKKLSIFVYIVFIFLLLDSKKHEFNLSKVMP